MKKSYLSLILLLLFSLVTNAQLIQVNSVTKSSSTATDACGESIALLHLALNALTEVEFCELYTIMQVEATSEEKLEAISLNGNLSNYYSVLNSTYTVLDINDFTSMSQNDLNLVRDKAANDLGIIAVGGSGPCGGYDAARLLVWNDNLLCLRTGLAVWGAGIAGLLMTLAYCDAKFAKAVYDLFQVYPGCGGGGIFYNPNSWIKPYDLCNSDCDDCD